MQERFASDGFALVADVLNAEECQSIGKDIPANEAASGGTRCLLVVGFGFSRRARIHCSRIAARDHLLGRRTTQQWPATEEKA